MARVRVTGVHKGDKSLPAVLSSSGFCVSRRRVTATFNGACGCPGGETVEEEEVVGNGQQALLASLTPLRPPSEALAEIR